MTSFGDSRLFSLFIAAIALSRLALACAPISLFSPFLPAGQTPSNPSASSCLMPCMSHIWVVCASDTPLQHRSGQIGPRLTQGRPPLRRTRPELQPHQDGNSCQGPEHSFRLDPRSSSAHRAHPQFCPSLVCPLHPAPGCSDTRPPLHPHGQPSDPCLRCRRGRGRWSQGQLHKCPFTDCLWCVGLQVCSRSALRVPPIPKSTTSTFRGTIRNTSRPFPRRFAASLCTA